MHNRTANIDKAGGKEEILKFFGDGTNVHWEVLNFFLKKIKFDMI